MENRRWWGFSRYDGRTACLMGALIALAFSLLLNAAGVASYLKQRDALVQARAQVREARGDEN